MWQTEVHAHAQSFCFSVTRYGGTGLTGSWREDRRCLSSACLGGDNRPRHTAGLGFAYHFNALGLRYCLGSWLEDCVTVVNNPELRRRANT